MQTIPDRHARLFLHYYKDSIIRLTSIHPTKTTPVFVHYDDFLEEYCLRTGWYDFAMDYGLEHGDQILFELKAIGGDPPPDYLITVIKACDVVQLLCCFFVIFFLLLMNLSAGTCPLFVICNLLLSMNLTYVFLL